MVLVGRSGNDPKKPSVAAPKAAIPPRAVSPAELRSVAASRTPLVYWAGELPSRVLELTEAREGRVYVRYLTPRVRIGDKRPSFLAVGTYAHEDAYGAVQAAAKRPGSVAVKGRNGGAAVYDRAQPTNVYLAFPGGREQIEVYSPSAEEARWLVRSGRIRPVTEPSAASLRAPRALTPVQLQSLAAASGPIYWAGPRGGKVYEVTRTGEGRVYVRYLPRLTDVGSPRADALTIATYPAPNAFTQIQAAARRPGAVTIDLAAGGLAVYDGARPTSIYLAYPDAKQQIEVFAPSPDEARRLVEAGQIQPVS